MASIGRVAPVSVAAAPVKVQSTPQATSSPPSPVGAQSSNQMGAADMYNLVVNPNDLSHLFSWGINTPSRMAFWGGGGIRRFLVSLVTGIPSTTLMAYAQEADLCKVPGMQSQWAAELYQCGIRGPMELAQYGGSGIGSQVQQGILFAQVAAKAIEMSANTGRVFDPPGPSDIANLAYAAQGMADSVS